MVKEAYQMLDGIPIWAHLMNNASEHKTRLKGVDYGRLAEWIGIREIRYLIKFRNFLEMLFPNITFLSVNRKKKRGHYDKEFGDYVLEISYKDIENKKYGKKVFILEIKHGRIEISQQQIRRYSEYIQNPAAYFRKADEVKVVFMLFTEINTMTASASYSLCEFKREFASKIIDAVPKIKMQENQDHANLFAIFGDT